MKYSVLTLSIIISLFLITQFVGLTANNHYIQSELPYGLKPPEIEPGLSPWFFVGMIVVVSVLFLLMRKLNFEILMKSWFFIAITICASITLAAFISPWMAFLVAVVLVFLKFKEPDLYVHNLNEILVYGGVVAIFAPVLNFWAAVILLVLVSIYDYVSVFITKHMIGLAEMQKEMGIFSGLLVVNKGEVAILGGGDIAFTLLFSTVVLKGFGMTSALFSVLGSALFLAILMLIGKKRKYYPAMPFVTAGCLLGFLISVI